MTTENAPRDRGIRRWAIGAAAVAIPLGLVALSAANFLQAAEQNAIAEREAATVATLERRLAALGGRVTRTRDLSAIYLAGETPALARAALQQGLGAAVEAVGGRLIESQDPGETGADDAPDDGRIDLRITFDARNDGLLDLLHALETGLPLLTVERVEARRLDAGADADLTDPMLRVGLIVRGYRRAPA